MNSLTHSLPSRLRSPLSQTTVQSASSVSVSSEPSNSYHFRVLSSLDPIAARSNGSHKFEIPIVGYEVIEEKAKFTVFKLRIQNSARGEYWFIFRRYTDFVRLLSKIKGVFPKFKLSLPRKRWFGDNFDSRFLDDRTQGLQIFVNSILQSQQLCSAKFIRDFFCLDEPPSYAESVEESRAIFEAMEETISHLQSQLKDKDTEIAKLRLNLATETKKKEELFKFVTSTTGKKCVTCAHASQNIGVPAENKLVHTVTAGGDHGPSKYMPQVMQVEDVASILAQLE